MTSEIHTVFSGAGISMGSPSSLPQGDQLADMAWRLLTQHLHVAANSTEEVRRRIKSGHLRLEQLLNVMTLGGVGMPLRTLVTVYEAVNSHKFNYLHARLAELDVKFQITVNMDTLLDIALTSSGKTLQVDHLHGRHDAPDTIITTISQYLEQLEPNAAHRLEEALLNKSVLVTGYSARDRDIHWLFMAFPPAELTWLVYPSGKRGLSASQLREVELSGEARNLLDTLRTNGTTNVHELRKTTEDHLDALLPAPSEHLVTLRETLKSNVLRVEASLPKVAEASYDAEPEWRRLLAVAAVFLDQGMLRETTALLPSINIPAAHADVRVVKAKIAARARRRDGATWQALYCLLYPVGDVPYWTQFKSVANETSASLGATPLYPVAHAADYLLLRQAERGDRRGTAFQIATRIAQHRSARGSLIDAERRFSQLSDKTVQGDVGLGTWINTLTWRADLLKVQGRISEAKTLLTTDIDDREYADSAQKAFLDWKLLELDLVGARDTTGIADALAELAAGGLDTFGPRAYCWLQLTRIGASSGAVLNEVDWPTVQKLAHRSADTEHFMYLQLAELARSQRNFRAVRHLLKAARRVERSRLRWTGSQTGRLAEQLISATAAYQHASTIAARNAAARSLDKTAKQLRHIGAHLPAERAALNAQIARNGGDLDALWQIVM
jgi:hypothetical protein